MITCLMYKTLQLQIIHIARHLTGKYLRSESQKYLFAVFEFYRIVIPAMILTFCTSFNVLKIFVNKIICYVLTVFS